MSNASIRLKVPVVLTPEEEETLYLKDSNPAVVTVNIENLKVDRMCSRCGHWKSEHPWETCREPNWL